MTAVMLSIRPEWCSLIAQGKKTIEVRKNRPKLGTPFKCYIYCTKAKKVHHCGCQSIAEDELFRTQSKASRKRPPMKWGGGVNEYLSRN